MQSEDAGFQHVLQGWFPFASFCAGRYYVISSGNILVIQSKCLSCILVCICASFLGHSVQIKGINKIKIFCSLGGKKISSES